MDFNRAVRGLLFISSWDAAWVEFYNPGVCYHNNLKGKQDLYRYDHITNTEARLDLGQAWGRPGAGLGKALTQ